MESLRILLSNSFSLNMIVASNATLKVTELTLEEARSLLAHRSYYSAVGHSTTAAMFSNLLGLPVQMNRETVALSHGDKLLVGQYTGPRLPEGSTSLPEGATVRWLLVELVE